MSEPGWVAQIDQMRASLRDLATVLCSYRKDLIAGGFDEGDAVMLVSELQASILHSPGGDEDE